MGYKSLKECVNDLEEHGHLIRIKEQVSPNLEMAAIHRRVFEAGGPALFFENIAGCEFPAISNLFGTLERSKFMFRDTLEKVKKAVELKQDPFLALKSPFSNLHLIKALPKKVSSGAILYKETTIDKVPQIKCWPNDGGPFILLPQVYTEDPEIKGWKGSNLGCYRIQLAGNEYASNEIGLHYQIHRGIGVHQTKWNNLKQPMKVSIFVGGPPSHTLASIMPLPEGISELTFAGLLGGRRFRYINKSGQVLSADADFVITGVVLPNTVKPEGPFGDHLGYYSLQHDFPVMKVEKVYHRKDAIWPFTVVGRPPQEDTQFGALIHEISGPAIPSEIPGLHEVNAVDAAGVHPLLFAIGSERYTPYQKVKQPQELLTIANHILGFGQMTLAKFLFISNKNDNPTLRTTDEQGFLEHIFERVDWSRDVHFYTKTTIDTLDYSGTGLNSGSKVVIAAVGEKKRELAKELPAAIELPSGFTNPKLALKGVIAVSFDSFTGYENAEKEMQELSDKLNTQKEKLETIALFVVTDDSEFLSATLNNFLWSTFTKSNPSHDIYGVNSFTEHKHWGCNGVLIIDARIKQHHAPPLIADPVTEKKVDELGAIGKPLHGII